MRKSRKVARDIEEKNEKINSPKQIRNSAKNKNNFAGKCKRRTRKSFENLQ